MTLQDIRPAHLGAEAGTAQALLPRGPEEGRPAGARAHDVSAFLCRDGEVGTVCRVLADVTETGACLVAVHGAPGTGKTTVVQAVARAARGLGFEVRTARAGKGGQDASPSLLHRLLPDLLPGLAPGLAPSPAPSLTSDLAPSLAPSLASGTAPVPGASPPDRQAGAVTRALGSQRPVLLTVDDVHHADTESVQWLASVPWLLAGQPIAVLVTVCNGEPPVDPVALDELVAGCAARVRLGPLPAPVVADLTRAALGGTPDPDFLTRVSVLTGGNPQLLRTLLDLLGDTGCDPTHDALATLAGFDLSPVVAVVQARLRRAAPEALTLACSLTALGGSARLDQVAGVAGIGLPRLAEAARHLVRMGMIAESDGVFSFTQHIVPAALRHELSFTALQTMHLQAARLLHESGAADEDVVTHLLRTSDIGEPWVVDRLASSARTALAGRRPGEAAAQLRRALAEPMPDELRGDLLRMLAESLAPTDVAAAAARLDEALALTTSPATRLSTGLALAQLLVLCDRRDTALTVLAGLARDLPPDLALEAEAVRLTLALPESGLCLDDDPVPVPHVPQDPPGAGTSTLQRRLAVVSAVRHCWTGRDREAAWRDAEEALAMLPTRPDEVSGYLAAAEALLQAGHAEEALRRVDRALRAVRSSDHPGYLAVARVTRAAIALQLGVLAEATDDASAAAAAMTECGASPTSAPALRARAILATVLLERGELDRAGDLVAHGEPLGDHSRHLEWAELLLARGRHSAALGDHDAAAAEFGTCGRAVEGWGPANPAVLPWRGLAARSLAALGDYQEAARLAAQEVELSRRWGAPVALGRALLAQGLCDPQGGLAALGEAIEVLRGQPAPLDLARAHHALGTVLHRQEERTQARNHLRIALGLAQQCDAAALAEQVRSDLAAAGARLRRLPQNGPDSLTASERTVAVLAASGHTNREIAESLFLQRRTVEIHLTNVYRKLHISGRDQLRQVFS